MIYQHPLLEEPVDQGDLVAGYPIHLAKHFADTFSRIGLPRPYETL